MTTNWSTTAALTRSAYRDIDVEGGSIIASGDGMLTLTTNTGAAKRATAWLLLVNGGFARDCSRVPSHHGPPRAAPSPPVLRDDYV